LKTITKKLYEGMFLVDSALAASDWDGINKAIEKILERAEADVVSIKKWDERKLAYEIGGKSRGTYILCYFKVEGSRIADIERDVQLSEQVLRVLILSTEDMSDEDLGRETPMEQAEKQREKAMLEAAERAEKAEAEAAAKAAEAAEAAAAEPAETVETETAEAETIEDAVAEPVVEAEAEAVAPEAEVAQAPAEEVAEETAEEVKEEVKEEAEPEPEKED
jgi:ribosomal protein S6